MARFLLNIATDNEAFAPTEGPELARILRAIAARIEEESGEDMWAYRTIRDANGNDVGRYALKPEEDRP